MKVERLVQTLPAPGLSEITMTPAVAIRIAAPDSSADFVAEEDQAEQRDLHRLGLDIGVSDHERALAHHRQHGRGGANLGQRAADHPEPEQRRRIAAGCSRSTIITPGRKTNSANGKPNRKRTWVAPTVPSVAVSSRCMALRAVCAAAAIRVKTAQSMNDLEQSHARPYAGHHYFLLRRGWPGQARS